MNKASRTIRHIHRDETINFLESSHETGGSHTLIRVTLGPGKAAPAHSHHRQTELFECVQGQLIVMVDSKRHVLKVGETATALPTTLHTFRNSGSEPCTFTVRITPGNPGWEDMMRCSFGLIADGECWGDFPKDITTIAVLMTLGEANLPGPLTWFEPWLNRRAMTPAGRSRLAELRNRYTDAFEPPASEPTP